MLVNAINADHEVRLTIGSESLSIRTRDIPAYCGEWVERTLAGRRVRWGLALRQSHAVGWVTAVLDIPPECHAQILRLDRPRVEALGSKPGSTRRARRFQRRSSR